MAGGSGVRKERTTSNDLVVRLRQSAGAAGELDRRGLSACSEVDGARQGGEMGRGQV